jgi:hypothetical protein
LVIAFGIARDPTGYTVAGDRTGVKGRGHRRYLIWSRYSQHCERSNQVAGLTLRLNSNGPNSKT